MIVKYLKEARCHNVPTTSFAGAQSALGKLSDLHAWWQILTVSPAMAGHVLSVLQGEDKIWPLQATLKAPSMAGLSWKRQHDHFHYGKLEDKICWKALHDRVQGPFTLYSPARIHRRVPLHKPKPAKPWTSNHRNPTTTTWSRCDFSGFSGLHPVATMVSRQLRHASSSNVKLSTKSSSCRMRRSRAMRKMKALNCTGSSCASLEIK